MPSGKRLHISPLNAQLLPFVLPQPLLEKASNVSFHTISTFPEKNYGYTDLPAMEAEKLTKKLNGSTLKGSKMRIEEARPKRQKKGDQEQSGEVEDAKALKKKNRKTRKEEGVIPGHELRDRSVRRGWTEFTDDANHSKRHKGKIDKKASRKASKKAVSATGEAECLFKTKLPPNAPTPTEQKDGKTKKRKRGESSRDVVVQEFSNTTKHVGFLRDESGAKDKKTATEFVEGKGWVDEDDNIVEAEPKRRKSKSKITNRDETAVKEAEQSRSRRSSRLESSAARAVIAENLNEHKTHAEEFTSTSGPSNPDSEGESDSTQGSLANTRPPQLGGKKQKRVLRGSGDDGIEVDQVERLSITRSSATPEQSKELAPTSEPVINEVHPLEALFKRPKTAASQTPRKPNLEVSTSFSFFDPEVEEGGSQGLNVPQTPFTRQDILQRWQRSAAPTPDTAAPGKTFGNLWEGTSDISEGDDAGEAENTSGIKDKSVTPDIKQEKPESEFSKWFWEQRGNNNRAWKKRRREAAKEKRYKGNKERGS